MLDVSSGAPAYVRALAPGIARALLQLVRTCGHTIHAQPSWDLLLTALAATCGHPDAVPVAADALEVICREPGCLSPANVMEAIAATSAVAERASAMLRDGSAGSGGEAARDDGRGGGRRGEVRARGEAPYSIDDVRRVVSNLEGVATWLQEWRQRQAQVRRPPDAARSPQSAQAPHTTADVQATALPESRGELHQRQWLAELATFWHQLLQAIASACLDWHPAVRAHALVLLHNVLTSTVEHVHLPADAWGTTWREVFLPMLNELASSMQVRDCTAPAALCA